MAEEFKFLFTVKQIEALLKALEECGINSGSFRSMLEHFHDPELIQAAQAAHTLLMRKGRKQAQKPVGSKTGRVPRR